MNNNFAGKKEIGCFHVNADLSGLKKNKENIFNKRIPIYFPLFFSIFFLGAIFTAFNGPFFKNIELASLVMPQSFDLKINRFQEPIISEPVRLPISNDRAYNLPLSPEKESPEFQKILNFINDNNLEVKFAKEEFKNGKHIEVDISDQTMMIYGEGELKGIYKVSTGMRGFATPVGNFKVLRKSASVWSVSYGCWMPYSLEFTSGLFIHELPVWPGGRREGENHLGIPVSHGCVRLGVGSAKEVYDFADIGTLVIIHN